MKPLSSVAALLSMTPMMVHAELAGVAEGEFSIFDVSGTYSTGGRFGFSYETDLGTHYLLAGAYYLEQDDIRTFFGETFEVDAVDFSFAYRYGFSFFDTFEPFLEYGWNFVSSDYNTNDAFGNPVIVDSDSSGDYIGLGVLYRISENIRLKADLRFHGILGDLEFSTPRADVFGNPAFVDEQAHVSGGIGLSFSF